MLSVQAARERARRSPEELRRVRNRAAGVMVDRLPEKFLEQYLWIQTKEAGLVRFRPNRPQMHLLERIRKQRKRTGRVRMIVLKARQQGSSTLIQGLQHGATVTRNNVRGLTVSHDQDGAENLFGMQQVFLQNDPEHLKLDTKYSNRKELVFRVPDWNWNSRVMVDTAANVDAGRSFTIHFLHCSEVAFYKKPDALMLSLLQSVPDSEGTEIYLESTANGVGNYFYRKYHEAKEGYEKGESEYEAVFVPWFWSEEYRRTVPPEGLDLTAEEEDLQERYGLDENQIAWRRYTIKEKCGGSVDQFRQEYPSNDEECFIGSGRNFFGVDAVDDYRKRATKPRTGEVRREGTNLVWEKSRRGSVMVWKDPEPKRIYVIGADVAEGKDGGDYSAAYVIDRDARDIVAAMRYSAAPDVFAEDLDRLGRWYNRAWLAVEANNHGLTTLTELRKHLRYPWMFYRKQVNKRTNKTTNELGWHTNVMTKPLVLDQLAAALRNGEIGIPDAGLLEEMRTFITLPSGKMEAEQGCHDDRVMAAAIAWWLCTIAPKSSKPPKPKPKEGTLDAYIQQLDRRDRRRKRYRRGFMR